MRRSFTIFASFAVLISLAAKLAMGQPNPAETGSVKITYKKNVLIVVANDGAAVIAFRQGDDNKVQYRFRYLSRDGKTTSSGSGELFERYKVRQFLLFRVLSDDGSKLRVSAGPIELGWSVRTPEQGWVYYIPKQARIIVAGLNEFDTIHLGNVMAADHHKSPPKEIDGNRD